MSAPELKPCPFCGGKECRFSEYMTDGGPRENVECENCSAELGGWKKPGKAITAWNTRTTSEADALRAENERLSANLEKWRGMYEREQTDNEALEARVAAADALADAVWSIGYITDHYGTIRLIGEHAMKSVNTALSEYRKTEEDKS